MIIHQRKRKLILKKVAVIFSYSAVFKTLASYPLFLRQLRLGNYIVCIHDMHWYSLMRYLRQGIIQVPVCYLVIKRLFVEHILYLFPSIFDQLTQYCFSYRKFLVL